MLPKILLPFLFGVLGMGMGILTQKYVNYILKEETDKVCFIASVPVIPALSFGVYLLVFLNKGLCMETIIYCLLGSVLLALAIIDIYSYEIPVACNYVILALGGVHLMLQTDRWLSFFVGMVSVSGVLLVIYMVTKGRAIGGGDVKLMGAAGLLLGFPHVLLAFLLGCIAVTVCHPIRMKFFGAESKLAFGPYLAMGIFVTAIWGSDLIDWYLRMCGL